MTFSEQSRAPILFVFGIVHFCLPNSINDLQKLVHFCSAALDCLIQTGPYLIGQVWPVYRIHRCVLFEFSFSTVQCDLFYPAFFLTHGSFWPMVRFRTVPRTVVQRMATSVKTKKGNKQTVSWQMQNFVCPDRMFYQSALLLLIVCDSSLSGDRQHVH